MLSNKKVICIGTSAGGIDALSHLFPCLNEACEYVFVVQHLKVGTGSFMVEHYNTLTKMQVCFANDKQPLVPRTVYLAPPNYHLMISNEMHLALDTGNRVNYAIPSIDILFENAAQIFMERCVGIILTGSNNDGSKGLKSIKKLGGYTIVQDPDEAEFNEMPQSAISFVKPHKIMNLQEIGTYLSHLII